MVGFFLAIRSRGGGAFHTTMLDVPPLLPPYACLIFFFFLAECVRSSHLRAKATLFVKIPGIR
jgi:hypothetical protein